MQAPSPQALEACPMSVLTDAASRTDLLNRLKRAEGQLRGIQRSRSILMMISFTRWETSVFSSLRVSAPIKPSGSIP